MANNDDNTRSDEQGGQPQGGQPQGGQPQGGQPQGGQPQGGQPQGGQPQGGQPQGGQPQGGQPQGGQPQGGRPQGGQPQGGQPPQGGPAGQPAGQQGYGQPGLADKLQQPAVMNQFKSVIGEYALLGVGFFLLIALGGLLAPESDVNNLAGILEALVANVAISGLVAVAIGFGPYLAISNAKDMIEALSVEANVLYAATFIANAAGAIALGLLALIGAAIGIEEYPIGELLVPVIAAAAVTGAMGIITVLYETKI